MFYDLTTITLAQVAITAAISFVLGFLWFSPLAFGDIWARAQHMKVEGDFISMLPLLVGAYIVAFAHAYGLAWVLELAQAFDYMAAVHVALMVGVLFAVAGLLSAALWHRRPCTVFLIEASWAVVNFCVMALCLVWMH